MGIGMIDSNYRRESAKKSWHLACISTGMRSRPTIHMILAIALFSIASLAHARDCTGILTPNWKVEDLTDVDQLLAAISDGLILDLANPEHRAAFELYRTRFFGNPNRAIYSQTATQIAETLKKYPGLRKKEFPKLAIQYLDKSFVVPKELKDFVQSLTNSMIRVKSNLLNVDANLGYWKKIFPESAGLKPEEFKKKHFTFLSETSTESLESLRLTKLFEALAPAFAERAKTGLPTQALGQALVDMIQLQAFLLPSVQQHLKSQNGLEVFDGIAKMHQERDALSITRGFAGHFQDALKTYGAVLPSGSIYKSEKETKVLSRIREEMLAGPFELKGTQQVTIRQLSIMEAGYRSCLGGSDCSTDTYLLRALNPNYHYFTLTDEKGHSSGHITIILGTAKKKSGGFLAEGEKTAAIDKIQNVPLAQLSVMLEGVRQILASQGYALSLDPELESRRYGEISNDSPIRNFIDKNVELERTEAFVNFTPHPVEFEGPLGYSRLEMIQETEIYPLKPQIFEAVKFESAGWTRHVPALNLSIAKVLDQTIGLKNGGTDDKIKYVQVLWGNEFLLNFDPNFQSLLKSWLQDSNQEFRLKYYIVRQHIVAGKLKGKVLETLSNDEKLKILQNLVQSTHYDDGIINIFEQSIGMDDGAVFEYFVNRKWNLSPKVLYGLLNHYMVNQSSKDPNKMKILLNLWANPGEGARKSSMLTEALGRYIVSNATDYDVVRLFVEKGADPNGVRVLTDGRSEWFIEAAIRKGDQELIRLLAGLGADPNAGVRSAMLLPNTSILKLLLRLGARMPSLIARAAIRDQNRGTLALFRAAGGNLRITTKGDESLLLVALRNQQYESFKYLLRKGASIDVPDGSLLIEFANQNFNNKDLEMKFWELISRLPIDINLRSSHFQNSALITALKNQKLYMVKFLVQKGAPLNKSETTKTWDIATDIFWSPSDKAFEIVEYLQSVGYVPNLTLQDRDLIIRYAIENRHFRTLEWVLKDVTDVREIFKINSDRNAMGSYMRYALKRDAGMEFLQLLLSKGETASDKPAYEMARAHSNYYNKTTAFGIFRFMIENGAPPIQVDENPNYQYSNLKDFILSQIRTYGTEPLEVLAKAKFDFKKLNIYASNFAEDVVIAACYSDSPFLEKTVTYAVRHLSLPQKSILRLKGRLSVERFATVLAIYKKHSPLPAQPAAPQAQLSWLEKIRLYYLFNLKPGQKTP